MTPQSILPILIAISFLAKQTTAQLVWKRITVIGTSRPQLRRDAGLGYDRKRNQLVLFGGRTTDGKVLNDVWFFDLKTYRWRTRSYLRSPPPRHGFVYGVSGNYAYMAMGIGKDGVYYNDIWRLDLVNNFWRELPARDMPPYLSNQMWWSLRDKALKPGVRGGAAGGIFENKTHFFVTFGSGEKKYSDVFSYDVTQSSWYTAEYGDGHPYSPSYPHARDRHSAAMIDEDSLLIFGGCLSGGGTGGPCPSGDSWLFDGKRKTWEQLQNCASPRTYSSMAMLPFAQGQRRVVVYGGAEEGKQVLKTTVSLDDEVAVFNPDTKVWTMRRTTGPRIPVKRMSTAMTTGATGIYIFGGATVQSGVLLDDLWLLDGDAARADNADVSSDCRTYAKSYVNLILLHGILMTLGWGFFLQLGALFARYLKSKYPLSHHLHKFCQVTGLVSALAGVVVAFFSVEGRHFQVVHGILGMVVMILGISQPIGALIRPRKPMPGEIKSTNRLTWEGFHHFTGRLSLVLALVTISLGLLMAVPQPILWILWFAYVGVLVLIYFFLEFYMRFSDRNKRVSKQITKDNYYAKLLNDAYTRTNSGRTSVTGRTASQVEAYAMKGIVNRGFEAPRGETVLELSQDEITQFCKQLKRPLSHVDEDKEPDPIYDNVDSWKGMTMDVIEEELEWAANKDEKNPPPVPEKKFDESVGLSVTETFESKDKDVDISDIFKPITGNADVGDSVSTRSSEVFPVTHL